MEFIKNTNIHYNEQVVVYKDNSPICLATVVGGTKKKIVVVFDTCEPPWEYKLVKGRESNAYICKETKTCLYFLGEPPYIFGQETQD